MQSMYTAIQTPDGTPDVGELVTILLKENTQQSAELSEIHSKLEDHLLHHEEQF